MEAIKNKSLFLSICLVLVGFFAFANTLPNQMFWDDNDFILNNGYVKNWHYTPNFFKENIIAGANLYSNYWRPVLLGVFSIEWHLWGARPVGYHAVNLLFHLMNGLLLFIILQKLFRNYFLSFLPALIFLVHPLQTEAVSYANSLGDSLSVFFILLGLWMFLLALSNVNRPYFKNWQYYVAVVMYPLALMSKEMAIIMPALLGLIWWFADCYIVHPVTVVSEAQDLDPGQKWISDSQLPIQPDSGRLEELETADVFSPSGMTQGILKLIEVLGLFIVIAGVYIFLRATILNFGGTFNLYGNENNLFTESVGVRIFTYFRIFNVYLGLLFWPQALHMERSVDWVSSFASIDVILGAVFFFFVLLSGIWQSFKRKPLGFGLLWFLIALAPTSNIAVPINGLIYEHWLYLPLAGFFVALATIICMIWEKFHHKVILRYFFIGVLIIFIVGLFVRTVLRNTDWRDPITFYTKTLQHSPNSYSINNNLAMEYANRQNLAEAEKYYSRALQIEPNSAVVYFNLGNLYLAQGKINLARQHYEQALSKDNKFWLAYPALINLYKAINRPKDAEKIYKEYLENIKKN